MKKLITLSLLCLALAGCNKANAPANSDDAPTNAPVTNENANAPATEAVLNNEADIIASYFGSSDAFEVREVYYPATEADVEADTTLTETEKSELLATKPTIKAELYVIYTGEPVDFQDIVEVNFDYTAAPLYSAGTGDLKKEDVIRKLSGGEPLMVTYLPDDAESELKDVGSTTLTISSAAYPVFNATIELTNAK
ncbi:hypothetical protein O6R05_01065 [Peptoniphilus equinus]|uniref:Lipoprotein n=1 Tax=Peptoniphilus equinus TaxID=3016343 RepID=A0ABY7QTR7_9FIRM|nr:hypothetical protein [Peptoniphilus equinus]WBW50179.1 hypothetical protein O6R05_01065 [Peptoniphilus equinus]